LLDKNAFGAAPGICEEAGLVLPSPRFASVFSHDKKTWMQLVAMGLQKPVKWLLTHWKQSGS
jgi:hypothetical protein